MSIPFDPKRSFPAICVAAQANKIPEGVLDYELSPINTILWGKPGIGKSALLRLLARTAFGAEKGMGLVDERISMWDMVSDRIPFPGAEGSEYFEFQYPSWLERLEANWDENSLSGSLLFMDELSGGAPGVVKRALGILQERTVGAKALPHGMALMCAANPTDVATGTFELSAPAANRLGHFEWDIDAVGVAHGMISGWTLPEVPVLPKDWWKGLDMWRSRVGTFQLRRPELILVFPEDEKDQGRAWPSPRSWENVSTVMAAADSVGLAKQLRRLLVSGYIGDAAGIEFITFLEYQDLVDPEEYVRTGVFDMPDSPDKRYAAVNAIISYCASRGKKAAFLRGVELLKVLLATGNADLAASQGPILFGPGNKNVPSGVNILEDCGEVFMDLFPAYKEMGIL